MRRFVLGWKTQGHEQRLDAHIVNYADDFVICCRLGVAEEAMSTMRRIMDRIGLTVNERKTRLCLLAMETFNRTLSGWANYFSLGHVTGAWHIVQQHACRRLRQWLHRKTKSSGGPQNPPDLRLYEDYGLLKLATSIRRHPLWAKAR